MRKNKKLFQALTLAGVLACGICIGAVAAGRQQQITATLDPDVAVTVDGVTQEFFDANGQRVYPILYNGSTYLPMRAVCEQLAGYKVGWDQGTRTASIATKDVDGVDLLDTQRAYHVFGGTSPKHYMSSDKKTKEINGYTLTHWFEYDSATGRKDVAYGASFNIEGKYDTVTLRFYSDQDATLQVVGDNESVLFSKDIKGGDLYQAVTVDLLKTNQLTLQLINRTNNHTKGYIYDVRLK